MRLLLLAGLLSLAALPARADDVPDYDVTAYCTDLAARSNANMAWQRHVCLEKEEVARGDVQARWEALAPEIRNTCDHFARQAGQSFFILGTCITSYVEDNLAKGRPERNKPKVYSF